MDIVEILNRKYNGKPWVLVGNSYEGLTWLGDDKIPTEKELSDLWPIVQAEIKAEEQAKIDARRSAIEKLQQLGLTVDEVRVAFGLEA